MKEADKIFIVNSSGYYNFYQVDEISFTGRATKGVKAIKLLDNEYIQSATIIKDGLEYKGILTIDASGRGKITPVEDFNTTSRGIRGSQVMNLKEGKIAAIYAVPVAQEKIFITANNKAVLLETKTIPIQNRSTVGIRIIDARNNENTNIEIM